MIGKALAEVSSADVLGFIIAPVTKQRLLRACTHGQSVQSPPLLGRGSVVCRPLHRPAVTIPGPG